MTNDMHLIWTVSGKRIDPANPDPALIDIEDIAYCLAGLNRFGAHTEPRYTVAEHSVMVSRLVPDDMALWGLMHDAGEGLLGCDVIGPVKRLLPCYRYLEAWMLNAIALGLDMPDAGVEEHEYVVCRVAPDYIKSIDKDVMAAESHFLGHGDMPIIEQNVYEAALERLRANAKYADSACALSPKERFLVRFNLLTVRGENTGGKP